MKGFERGIDLELPVGENSTRTWSVGERPMSMGEVPSERQPQVFVAFGDLTRSPGHPFYYRISEAVVGYHFDRSAGSRCVEFYSSNRLRPIIPPVNAVEVSPTQFTDALERVFMRARCYAAA